LEAFNASSRNQHASPSAGSSEHRNRLLPAAGQRLDLRLAVEHLGAGFPVDLLDAVVLELEGMLLRDIVDFLEGELFLLDDHAAAHFSARLLRFISSPHCSDV
jgi:hypothetical protein